MTSKFLRYSSEVGLTFVTFPEPGDEPLRDPAENDTDIGESILLVYSKYASTIITSTYFFQS